MNGFNAAKNLFGLLLACALIIVANGCKKNSPTHANQNGKSGEQTQLADGSPQSGPDAETIIGNLLAKYSSARTYSDRSVLYLDYRMHGRSIQEPQPWGITWDQTGRLAARLFNAQVRCDGQLLSCYVFDIETANLDNQHLLIPCQSKLPIAELFRDPIARHFVGGYSELPLDESDLVSVPKLIPPTISLLTNEVQCGWLQNPSQVQRLADESIDDVPCYVVRCLSEGTTADVWIDQNTLMLVQMSLPLKLLAGEVITSPEITDVFLLAKFHEAVIDGEVTDEMFAIEPRKQSTPVRKYVELPPAFPSELIGQTAPQFQLMTSEEVIRTKLFFDGKVTAFLWLGGTASYSAIEEFESLANDLPADKFHLASVYSDSELKAPGTGSFEVVDDLAKVIKASRLQSYYDQQLAASSALRVKAIPSVVVMDGDSRVQFARALSDKTWAADVKAALQRIANGDDVAIEMQAEYQLFLDSYHQQLVTVSAADLIQNPERKTPQLVNGTKNRLSMRLRPEQSWVNTQFKQAGNVAVLELGESANTRLFVFDGFQTVVELGADGTPLSRHELPLPEGEAANLIRIGSSSDGTTLFAVLSALGKQAFLFDRSWHLIGTYPNANMNHAGIRDCQFVNLDSNEPPELLVAFDDDNGIHRVNPVSNQGEKVSDTVATSLTRFGAEMVIAAEGKVGGLKTGLQNVEESELKFQRVLSDGDLQICGLGVTENGNWNAVGFDSELNRVWTLAIGSQFFESQIEPIAVTRTSGDILWAIADTDDIIHLVSGGGKWLGDFRSENRLAGVSLATINGQTSLIVSNAGGVECWNLNLEASPMRPVSSGK